MMDKSQLQKTFHKAIRGYNSMGRGIIIKDVNGSKGVRTEVLNHLIITTGVRKANSWLGAFKEFIDVPNDCYSMADAKYLESMHKSNFILGVYDNGVIIGAY